MRPRGTVKASKTPSDDDKHVAPASRRDIFCLVALLALAQSVLPGTARSQEVPELQITSTNYIVLDAETGEVYAQRGAHERAAMASLTKIFTTIEALERAPLDQTITTRQSDVFDASSTRLGFGPGETFTLKDLLYGMMLPSGNDAAHAIARALGRERGDSDDESVDRFIGWMNQRIDHMGLTDTQLVNPHGWGVPGHYSTVYDLAAFTRYALQYPLFVDLISTSIYTTSNGYQITNTNRMLNFYPGIIGGKTGYDDDAGYCLIEVATRGDTTMISVTLDGVAPDDWYDDNRVLLDYAFETKAARDAEGIPFAGDVVRFLDPDAAVLAQTASSGGALPVARMAGGPSNQDVATNADDDAIANAKTANAATNANGATESKRWWVSIGLALLLIVGRVTLGLSGQPLPRLRGDRLWGIHRSGS